MNFLNLDSPITHFLSRIIDFIILNLLWIICSLPIITIGASTSALYYCMMKIIRETESGIVKMFFQAFKQNLKQGCCLTIIFIATGAFLVFDLYKCMTLETKMSSIVELILCIMLIIWMVIISYAFPLLAQFENTTKNIIKNAVGMSLVDLKKTIMIVLLNLVPIILFLEFTYYFMFTLPLWSTIGISIIAYVNAKMFVKIFDKYI